MNWYKRTKFAFPTWNPGHPMKWTPKQLARIEKDIKAGVLFSEIAKRFGVTPSTIGNLNRKYKWSPTNPQQPLTEEQEQQIVNLHVVHRLTPIEIENITGVYRLIIRNFLSRRGISVDMRRERREQARLEEIRQDTQNRGNQIQEEPEDLNGGME